MLDAILTIVAGLILLGCLLFFCVAAVAMNVGERRQRDNRTDFQRRQAARAEAREAIGVAADEVRAKHKLFPSAGRVENKSYLRRRAS